MGEGILQFFRDISTPFLDGVFLFITEFGGDMVTTAVIAAILWCIDKKSGYFIAFAGFMSFSVNGIIKDIFRIPRPMAAGIKANETAAKALLDSNGNYSYSFPSGHSQNSSALAASLCLYKKDKRLCIAGGIIVFSVGLSRMFLGVHYPADVIAGWLIGAAVSYILYKIYFKYYEKRIIIFFIAAFAMLFAAFFWGEDTAKSLGGLLGFALGSLFEDRFVNYTIKGISRLKLFIRLITGLSLLLLIRTGLSFIFPDTILILHYIRYAVIIFFGVGIYPYIFTKLGF